MKYKITKAQYVALVMILTFIARQYGLDDLIGLGDGEFATLLTLIQALLVTFGVIDNSGEAK